MGDGPELERRLAAQATWSFALGLLSAAGSFLVVVLPAAVAGLVLGIRARNSNRRAQAVSGIVLSALALLVCLFVAVNMIQAIRTFGWNAFLNSLRFLPVQLRDLQQRDQPEER